MPSIFILDISPEKRGGGLRDLCHILNGTGTSPSKLYYRHVDGFHISQDGCRNAHVHIFVLKPTPATLHVSNLSIYLSIYSSVHHPSVSVYPSVLQVCVSVCLPCRSSAQCYSSPDKSKFAPTLFN
jgi:hypothetical protein